MNTEERIKEIDAKIAELRIIVKEKDKKWFEDLVEKRANSSPVFDFKSEFDEYQEYLNPENDIIGKLSDERRMIQSYELSPLPTYGDVMSMKDFIESCESGCFIDYDGHGNYVKDGMMTNIGIFPSDIDNGNIRKEFDTMIWFNR